MVMREVLGAPRVDAFTPLPGTCSGRFFDLLSENWAVAEYRLSRLVAKWRPLAGFVEVNFMHPVWGPSGALVLTTTTVDMSRRRQRMARLEVIPHREVAPYVPRWSAGQTVLVHVDEMPPELARRYVATRVRWSLNVPVMAGGEWVGLVGGAAAEQGFEPGAISGFSALARLFGAELVADEAWTAFTEDVGNRLPHLVR